MFSNVLLNTTNSIAKLKPILTKQVLQCEDEVVENTVEVPEESCSLGPETVCRNETVSLPQLVPEQQCRLVCRLPRHIIELCRFVPREVCRNVFTSPRLVPTVESVRWSSCGVPVHRMTMWQVLHRARRSGLPGAERGHRAGGRARPPRQHGRTRPARQQAVRGGAAPPDCGAAEAQTAETLPSNPTTAATATSDISSAARAGPTHPADTPAATSPTAATVSTTSTNAAETKTAGSAAEEKHEFPEQAERRSQQSQGRRRAASAQGSRGPPEGVAQQAAGRQAHALTINRSRQMDCIIYIEGVL